MAFNFWCPCYIQRYDFHFICSFDMEMEQMLLTLILKQNSQKKYYTIIANEVALA